ncbi:MAG: AAA family ATPase [Actinomycetota bacterium]
MGASVEHASLVLVVAPAGSGKTTFLSHVSHQWPGDLVWIAVDAHDREPARFEAKLAAALGSPADGLDVYQSLSALTEPLVIIDDVHELAGSPTVETLDLLRRFQPPDVTLVISTRHLNELPGSPWQTSPGSALVDGEDLRFRLWEVTDLLRDHHQANLTPSQTHDLTRATGGWAVALHLFGLTARNCSPAERSELIENLAASGRVRDYLLDQVLSHLDPGDVEFLRTVCVFGTLDGPTCDEFLGVHGSAEVLDRLHRWGVLAQAPDGTFSMHRVVRNHLHHDLLTRRGRGDLESLYLRCGDLLAEAGLISRARVAWARGGAWDRVRPSTETAIAETLASPALDDLPLASLDLDPWVLQCQAVRYLSEGDVSSAYANLRTSSDLLADEGINSAILRQLRLLGDWLEPPPGPPVTWPTWIRCAIDGRPLPPPSPDEPLGVVLGRGWAAVVAGRGADAEAAFDLVAHHDSSAFRLFALFGNALQAALAGNWALSERSSEMLVDEADKAGWPVLVRLANALRSARSNPTDWPALARHAEGNGDPTGAAVIDLIFGLLAAELPNRADVLDRAALRFESGPGQALAVIAQLGAAIARGEGPPSHVSEGDVRRIGPFAQALRSVATRVQADPAGSVLRSASPSSSFDHVMTTLLASARTADIPSLAEPNPIRSGAGLTVRCIGQLSIQTSSGEADLSSLRPKHLDLLRVFACHPGEWLHRSKLITWLWPHATESKGKSSLQTAVSGIRKVIDDDRDGPSMLERNGEQYRLAVDPESADVGRVMDLLQQAIDEQSVETRLDLLDELVSLSRGELAPGSGPSEWAVEVRQSFRRRLAGGIDRVLTSTPAAALGERQDLLTALTEQREPADPMWEIAIKASQRAGCEWLADDLEAARFRWLDPDGSISD